MLLSDHSVCAADLNLVNPLQRVCTLAPTASYVSTIWTLMSFAAITSGITPVALAANEKVGARSCAATICEMLRSPVSSRVTGSLRSAVCRKLQLRAGRLGQSPYRLRATAPALRLEP